jgi:hypothetical protein
MVRRLCLTNRPILVKLNAWETSCRTWPAKEQVIDYFHKAVYAFTTGYFSDIWIAGPGSRR